MNKKNGIILILIGILILLVFVFSFIFPTKETFSRESTTSSQEVVNNTKVTQHLTTPEPLKGVYMTSCVAATPSLREKIVSLIERTEINAIVIDIKDYTGRVSFDTGNSEIDNLMEGASKGCKVSDMKEFVNELHQKNIYVIGRVAVFQDPLYVKAHPELAVKKQSDGSVWADRKGISFIDVGAKPFWDYIISITKASYEIGFDEINFDYIRFPSDGNMQDIYFPYTKNTLKKEMLRQFFAYLNQNISGTGLIISADLFGMTTTNSDDLGIGQILEYALLNFDYVCPMVYPSHYPNNFNNWPDPNKVPYEIVKFSMDSAVARDVFLHNELLATSTLINGQLATTTPDEKLAAKIKPLQLRPWLQDNDYPVTYTAEMVRKQIQATYDSGLTSWMLWDPANTYTEAALLKN